MELARTRVTGFPWNLLGIAQVDNGPLCRIAATTGVYGISFEIALVNVALAAAFLVPREKRGAMLAAALAAAAVLQAGRLIDAPPARADHAALLVQQNIPVAADWTQPGYFQQTLTDLIELTETAAQKNATTVGPDRVLVSPVKLIVWPESPAPFFTNDAHLRNSLDEMAHATKAWIVVGTIGVATAPQPGTEPALFNSAALISPDVGWVARYDKIHLVPFGEYLPFPSLFSFAGGLTKEVGQFGHGTAPHRAERGRRKARRLHLLRIHLPR